MSLHISKREAKERALQLAMAFLCQQDSKGWSWTCAQAQPQLFDPQRRGRKVPARWTVAVEFRKDGGVLDGPGMLEIDIEKGTVAWQGSA